MGQLDLRGWDVIAGEESDLLTILQAVAADGGYQAMAQIGIDDQDITNLVNTYAQDYARQRSAEMVGKKWVGGQLVNNPDSRWVITDSTRDLLRTDVTQAIDEGWSSDHLARIIEWNYAFSSTRAEMIARTEIAFADVAGNMQAYRESGIVEGKQWILAENPCELCIENAEAGIIGLDDDFPNGVDAPPQHPHCECDVIPVTKDNIED